MSNRFHNKFHRHNHHTRPTDRDGIYPDSAYDPIASPDSPFEGEFYVDGNLTTLSSISAAGDLYTSNATFEEDVTIKGNLTVLGDTTEVNTFVYITSALDISNTGTGPALRVAQSGSQPIAHFIDNNGDDIIFADNGYVGLGAMSPNEKLTVIGNISATGVIYASGGNSINWNSVYSSTTNTSASWDSVYSSVKNTSANWDSVYSSTKNTSANWDSVYSSVKATSANWNSVYSSVTATSANWDSVYSSTKNTSANWDSVYSNVKSNSASYATIDFANSKFFALTGGRIDGNVTIFGDLTSTGTQTFANTIFSTTSSLSVVHVGTGPAVWVGNTGSGDIASFNDIDQGIEMLHVGGVNSTSPNVGVKTSNPNKTFTVNGEISASSTIWDADGNSNQWNSVYSSVKATSANFNSVYSNVTSTSANWNSVYTNVQSNSSIWSNMLPASGGTITGNLTANNNITAPNATSVASNQVANVGTLDARYWGSIERKYAPLQTIDTLGTWVQVVSIPGTGYRTISEFASFMGTDNNLHASFELIFTVDPYEGSSTAGRNIPHCLAFRQMQGSPFTSTRVRMVTSGGGVNATCLDLLFTPSTSGINTYIFSRASLMMHDISVTSYLPNISTVVDPVTAGCIVGPEFMLANNAIIKSSTGDYALPLEGQTVINNADNNIKIFAEGAWRQIASW